MFIKFYKIIHNKFSRFFKFIFFLRYLIVIFFISIAIFLIIPNFFNYEKRAGTITSYLLKNYNIEIKKYEKIRFEALPIPKIKIENVLINFDGIEKNLKVKSLKIYPQLISIYNYKNLETKKVILKDNKILLQVPEIKPFIEKFFNKKKKFIIDNLEIDIYDERQSILKLKDIYYANFGYDENLITGIIFKKKFKVKIDNNSKDINFELLKSGISANVNSNKNNLIDLDLRGLLEEYSGKNLALIIIEYRSINEEKIYLKSKIQGKNIVKKLIIKNTDLSEEKFFEKIIIEVKKELINLIKSQNLIDIRTPSFLNANLQINDISNLEELKVRLKKIDLIEKIYVQEFNNEKISLKIKYLGKLDKIIRQLEENNILLRLKKEQWSIKIL